MVKPRRSGLTPRLVLDTGALIGLERDDERAFEHIRMAAARGFLVVVPTSVVMEAIAAARSMARINQILRKIDLELPLGPPISRSVHALRKRAGTGSDADAIVVLEALAVPGSVILTDDRRDIDALLAATPAKGMVPVLLLSGKR